MLRRASSGDPAISLSLSYSPKSIPRYDREFLLQFRKICTEKPVHLPPLETIGLDPLGEPSSLSMSRGGSG